MADRDGTAVAEVALALVATPAGNRTLSEVTRIIQTILLSERQQTTEVTSTTLIVQIGSPEWTITPGSQILKMKNTVPTANRMKPFEPVLEAGDRGFK